MAAASFKWIVLVLGAVIPLASPAAASHHHHHHHHHHHRARGWHPSERRYPTQGIDVSHYQGGIAWAQLPRQGVDFAYIKATEGADNVDGRFAMNWRAAHAAGIRRGAYHFFSLCRSGRDQAAHFLRHVPTETASLPPAVDLEFPGNCHHRPSKAKFHKELGDFLRIVEARYGEHAVLYLTRKFDRHYRVSATFERPLWLRSLRSEPSFGARRWTIWQSSSSRRLAGVHGHVDWNVARRPV